MSQERFRVSAALVRASAALAALLAGCATNPVTGRTQLALISESREIELGRQADEQVQASIGAYPDAGLQRYVSELGLLLARDSERPQLPWTFRVVDDPTVNAFALPGGYVYVTRGILAHFDSEAELAAVLGHEIGHVTARHSVSQMSKQQLAQVGLGLGVVLGTLGTGVDLRPLGSLAQAGLGVMFLKFSRDDESQADALGFAYLTRHGYDPRPMAHVFQTLERVGQAAGAQRLPDWLATHPNPGDRRRWVEAQLAASGRSFEGAKVERESYLRRLDGLVFGANPREGFFREGRFHHPDLAFRLEFPVGWKTQNTKQAVGAQSPEQDAIVALTLARGATPAEAARAFFSQQGLHAVDRFESQPAGGLPSEGYVFVAQGQQGQIPGVAAFTQLDGRVFQLLGYSAPQAWRARSDALARAIASFARETDPAVLAVQPRRLSLVELREGGRLDEVAARHPSSIGLDEIARINGVDRAGSLAAGSLFKRVTGGPEAATQAPPARP
jgi:predicted Zn-dependent protease